jgi:YHS domain-containing protein
MEYQGRGWLDPSSNAEFARPPKSEADHPRCIICGMEVDPATAPKSEFRGANYFFCSTEHKAEFDAQPARIVELAK